MSMGVFAAYSAIKGQTVDDDTGDRLSHVVTVGILICSAMLISTKQLVGEPISCWVPAHFTGNWEKYTENYCWIKNTYKLQFDQEIPKPHEEREDLVYYQWIPLILLVQALFFYMPRLFWGSLQRRGGLDLGAIINHGEVIQNTHNQKINEQEDALMAVVGQFQRVVDHRRKRENDHRTTFSLKSVITRNLCKTAGRTYGNYLMVSYFMSKILYLLNIILQFIALNAVLGFGFYSYGIEVIRRLAGNKDWTEQVGPFPRVTMCDIKVRRLGNIHRYSMQCVLPINLFNEKLYLFLWFWLIAVGSLTLIETFTWFKRLTFNTEGRRQYIQKHLKLAASAWSSEYSIGDEIEKHNKEFVDEYLMRDGVFALRLVGRNTNTVTVTLITRQIFIAYLASKGVTITRRKPEEPDEVEASAPPYDKEMQPLFA